MAGWQPAGWQPRGTCSYMGGTWATWCPKYSTTPGIQGNTLQKPILPDLCEWSCVREPPDGRKGELQVKGVLQSSELLNTRFRTRWKPLLATMGFDRGDCRANLSANILSAPKLMEALKFRCFGTWHKACLSKVSIMLEYYNCCTGNKFEVKMLML